MQAGALLTSENGVLEPVGLIAGVAASIYLIYSSYRRFDSVGMCPRLFQTYMQL